MKVVTSLHLLVLLHRSLGFQLQPQFVGRGTAVMTRFASSSITPSPRVVSDELYHLMNSQVTRELEASQLYLAASIWCDENDLIGMADFMRRESEEERSHALAFIEFATKRNIPIELEDIDAPVADWEHPEELWEDLLQAEGTNTHSLLELGDAAANCRDHAVSTFLMPYHMVCSLLNPFVCPYI